MANSKLGNKHICISCGTKFYDFDKPRPVCPKCGTDQEEEKASKFPTALELGVEEARLVKEEPEATPAPDLEELDDLTDDDDDDDDEDDDDVDEDDEDDDDDDDEDEDEEDSEDLDDFDNDFDDDDLDD